LPITYIDRLGALAGKGEFYITNVTSRFTEAKSTDGRVFRVLH
jgi:hypothetical protein